jgi:hypothetical protein
MALSKSVQTPFGVEATYWLPGRITIDKASDSMSVVLLGYVCAAARERGCAPVLGMPDLVFRLADFPGETDIRGVRPAALYAAVRARIADAVLALEQEAHVAPSDPRRLLAELRDAMDC